jgi:peptidoglycan/xylan/chitin deacetylase (PgdA/CDA1 family)
VRAILTYHSIDASGSPISVHPEEFRAHVRFLASGRLRVAPLDQIAGLPDDADAVALTFDDGFANFASEALPLLREHHLPATVFVVAGCVGATNAWDRGSDGVIPEMPLMDWDAIAESSRHRIEIGAHSLTHADLTTLGPDECEREVAGSGERIAQQLGVVPRSFAYPYGRLDTASREVASTTYARACGTELRLLHRDDDPFVLPRVDMYYFREQGRLESWGTPAFRRRLWFRAQGRRVRGMAARVGVSR